MTDYFSDLLSALYFWKTIEMHAPHLTSPHQWLKNGMNNCKLKHRLSTYTSQDEIEEEETGEVFSSIVPPTRSATAVSSEHDYRKKSKPILGRFFKSAKDKYVDYNDNEIEDSQSDPLPQISSKRSLSSEDLPRNFERNSDYYNDLEQNSQEHFFPLYSLHTKRESFDSTAAQRPFSPCSTLAASDFSVCEEDIVLLSPRFRGISSQRRASDGMVQRIPTQWGKQESYQELSSSSTDISRTSSRASSRPATPAASPSIKIKASGGFKLPPLGTAKARKPKLQELPSITVSENSGSGSQGSLDSISDEQPCAAPKHPLEGKSFIAAKKANYLLQKRRGSLPTVTSTMRHSALPIVKEHPQAEEVQNKQTHVSENLQIPRHRFRSKSLDGQLVSTSEWEEYKARALQRRARKS